MTSKKNTTAAVAELIEDDVTTEAPVEVEESKPKGRFAALEEEALEGYVPFDPYVIDDVEPPIVIEEPTSTEQVLALAAIYRGRIGDDVLNPEQFESLLRTICGDQFERVWYELPLKGKNILVAKRFLEDVQIWFQEQKDAQVAAAAADKKK